MLDAHTKLRTRPLHMRAALPRLTWREVRAHVNSMQEGMRAVHVVMQYTRGPRVHLVIKSNHNNTVWSKGAAASVNSFLQDVSSLMVNSTQYKTARQLTRTVSRSDNPYSSVSNSAVRL